MSSADIMHIKSKRKGEDFIHICIFTPKGQADKPFNLSLEEYAALKQAIKEDEN